jgi:peptide/nickel transport system substrate-binding protein
MTLMGVPPALSTGQGGAQGTLILAHYEENLTLDVTAGTQRSLLGVVRMLMFDPLIRRDARGRFQPALAESWRQVAPTSWEFKLRQGVKFHNGEPFDAQSVKFTVERLLDPKRLTAQGFLWTGLKSVDIVDPYLVRINTVAPMGPFLANMALGAMLPPKVYNTETFATNPIGTGPFKFVKWTRGDRLEMEANLEYWGGPPKSRRVVFLPIKEDSTRMAGVQAGQIHIAIAVPIPMVDVMKQNPQVSVISVLSAITQELSVAGDARAPLGNPKVLQAVSLAINREQIVKNVFRGRARVPRSIWGPMIFGAHPSLPLLKYDPDQAVRLMTEAGLGAGVEVEMWYTAGGEAQIADVVQVVAEDLRKIGIRTRIRVAPDWTVGGPILNGKRFDLYYNGWGSITVDPDFYLSGNYHPTGRNREGVTKYPFGSEVVELVECGRNTTDLDARRKCYLRLQELLWANPPRVPIVVPHDIYAVRKEVKGFAPRSDMMWDLKDVYVEGSR